MLRRATVMAVGMVMTIMMTANGVGMVGVATVSASTPSAPTWSGIAAFGKSQLALSAVGSTWVVPMVTCPPANETPKLKSVMWDGVGEGTSVRDQLYQIGTDSDCLNGEPSYGAWWEDFYNGQSNQDSVTIKKADTISGGTPVPATVQPGDEISSAVSLYLQDAGGYVEIVDNTQGWVYFRYVNNKYVNGRSVECILERPSYGLNGTIIPWPLADFGSTTFGSCDAVDPATYQLVPLVPGSSIPGLPDTPVVAMTMTDSHNRVLAMPSNFTSTGGFTDTWERST
jgi:Peptidase A4 family